MKCRKCTGELTRDEERGCYFCPVCNPVPTAPVIAEEPEPNKRVDEPWTDKRIREIVQDELMNWHIKKPSVTASEIKATVGGGEANVNETVIKQDTPKPETWRETAKRLEIPVYDKDKKCPRKKVDVLSDIEAKQKVPA